MQRSRFCEEERSQRAVLFICLLQGSPNFKTYKMNTLSSLPRSLPGMTFRFRGKVLATAYSNQGVNNLMAGLVARQQWRRRTKNIAGLGKEGLPFFHVLCKLTHFRVLLASSYFFLNYPPVHRPGFSIDPPLHNEYQHFGSKICSTNPPRSVSIFYQSIDLGLKNGSTFCIYSHIFRFFSVFCLLNF
jgi:hypothetical protein